MASYITVLLAPTAEQATKTARLIDDRWVTKPQGKCKEFTAIEVEVSSIDDVAGVIEIVRQENPRGLLIAGRLSERVRAELEATPDLPIVRRGTAGHGDSGTIDDVLRQWICIDIDKWLLQAGADLVRQPAAAIRAAVRDLLPPAFHNTRAFWQLSSSAGFANQVLKAHVFFWLSQPVTNAQLKLVLQQHAPLLGDFSTYHALQPVYIQNPRVISGPDPLPHRTGWLDGAADAVVLPEPVPVPTIDRNRIKRAGTALGGGIGLPGEPMERLGDGPGLNGFHEPLRTATMRYAAQCVGGKQVRDDNALKAKLRGAIFAAPYDRYSRTPADLQSYASDLTLDGLIAGAIQRLRVTAMPERMAPEYGLPQHTRDEARREVAQAVERFFTVAKRHAKLVAAGIGDFHPVLGYRPPPSPQLGLAVSTGVGKSQIAREKLPTFITEMKQAELPHRVLVTVPEHRLGAEMLEAMRLAGLRAATWRGRDAADPDAEGNVSMCRDRDAVHDALAVGAEVETTVCAGCRLRETCGYQRQKLIVTQADVVIAAHNSLFHRFPAAISNGLGLVIADEAFWTVGVREPSLIAVDGFAQVIDVHPVLDGKQQRDVAATAELLAIAQRLEVALANMPAGKFLPRSALVAAGLTAELCDAATRLEWRRKRDVLRPEMNAEERKRAVKSAIGNAQISRRARLWDALTRLIDPGHDDPPPERCGEVKLDVIEDETGQRRVLRLFGIREFNSAVQKLPLLHLDATLPPEIVQRFAPRLRVKKIDARAEHAKVIQIAGRWGMASLGARQGTAPTELAQAVRDFVATRSAGDCLVITYQQIEPLFAELQSIRTLHFGRVNGLDAYRDVRTLFVVGRPLPSDHAIWELAQGLFASEPIEPETAAMMKAGALLRGGTGQAIDVRRFVDHRLEAVRRAITDAAVVQGIGRGRGVNRTADNPLDIYVLADVALPVPVEVVPWADVEPNPIEQMLVAKGCAALSPTDAAKLFGDMFSGMESARRALERVHPDWPRPAGVIEVRYRPAGIGCPIRRALVVAKHMERVRNWITEVIGPLAKWEPAPGA